MPDLYVIIAGIIGLLSVFGGSYYKGRKDKDNENKAEELGSATDAKERLESIQSIDDDADYIERVRNSER